MTRKKIGLALGGGIARGLAHIGVIKTLEEAGIEISFISGTSMGALVGGWYAATKDIKALEDIFLNSEENGISEITKIFTKWDKDSLDMKDSLITKIFKEKFKNIKIEDCKIPFEAIATDVKNGDEVIIKKGSLVEAVKSSIAIPIILNPALFDNRLLMDGTFCNPVPADVAKNMGSEIVIAVDVSSKWIDVSERQFGWRAIPFLVLNVFSAMEYQLARTRLKSADIVLNPLVLNFGWFEFNRVSEIIRAGVKETKAKLKEIFSRTGYPEPAKTPFEKFLDFILSQE